MADITNMFFSADKSGEIQQIIDLGVNLTIDAMDDAKRASADYASDNQKYKHSILNFCADQCGIRRPDSDRGVRMAFANVAFESLFNSIISEIQSGVMVRAQSPALMAMCNVVNVDAGDSYTWEIDTKGLPVVQRASLTTNMALRDSYSMTPITITPIPYVAATVIDYIRVLANDFDFGREMARVYQAHLYKQTSLVASAIFSTTATPAALYQATWNGNNYVKMAEVLSSLNNGAGVTSYGTRTAWNSIGALATTGGYSTKDRFIENGYLQKIYGIDSVLVENAADLSAPLASTLASVSLAVPTNLIVMLSGVGDKPVKLVRENYVRIQKDDQNAGSLNRLSYKYFMSYDVGLATQAHFAVQNVAST